MARPWESALHFEPTPGLSLTPKCRANSARRCQVVPLPQLPVPCLPRLRPPVRLAVPEKFAALVLLDPVVPVLPHRSVQVLPVLPPLPALFCYRCRFLRSRLVSSVRLLPLIRCFPVLTLLLIRHRSALALLGFLGPEAPLRVFLVGVVRYRLVQLQPVALPHL